MQDLTSKVEDAAKLVGLHVNAEKTKMMIMGTRDVNFVFFQKSIIVLKKSIFFRLSNLGVASLYATGYCITCRAHHV